MTSTWEKYRHKMASRVCASMLYATGFGDEMTATDLEDYEERAVSFAKSMSFTGDSNKTQGALVDLRRNIYLNRNTMPLFDTARWTKNIEKGFRVIWQRWVDGTQFEASDEWEACNGPEKESSCVFVQDEKPSVTYY